MSTTQINRDCALLHVTYKKQGHEFRWCFLADKPREGLREITKAAQWDDVPYDYTDAAEITKDVREFLGSSNATTTVRKSAGHECCRFAQSFTQDAERSEAEARDEDVQAEPASVGNHRPIWLRWYDAARSSGGRLLALILGVRTCETDA